MNMLQGTIAPRRHRPAAEQRPRLDAASSLIRALLELAKGQAILIFHEGHDWQSATFTGMRHNMALEFIGNAAIERGRHVSAILADHEFDLHRHIVVDIAVGKSHERRQEDIPVLQLDITALTVEDI